MQPESQRSRRTRPAHRRRQGGATMIEFLVSVLIFAFGMLGLIGMQTKTLGYSQSSLYRSQATALADDVLDRMRADRSNARLGSWDTPIGERAASVSGSSLSKTDLADWKGQVERLLPSGKASVGFAAATGVVSVSIEWSERGQPVAFPTNSAL